MINSISFGAFKVSALKLRLNTLNPRVHIAPDKGPNAGKTEIIATKILDYSGKKLQVEGYAPDLQPMKKDFKINWFGVCKTHSIKEPVEKPSLQREITGEYQGEGLEPAS